MANAHRKLGPCAEMFPKEGGWVVQLVTVSDVPRELNPDERQHEQVPEYAVETVKAGVSTRQEAQSLALQTGLPVFILDYDPNA